MWGHRGKKNDGAREEANNALRQSLDEWYAVQDLKHDVEDTVRGHLKLQLENHFAERIWLAYRGEDSR